MQNKFDVRNFHFDLHNLNQLDDQIQHQSNMLINYRNDMIQILMTKYNELKNRLNISTDYLEKLNKVYLTSIQLKQHYEESSQLKNQLCDIEDDLLGMLEGQIESKQNLEVSYQEKQQIKEEIILKFAQINESNIFNLENQQLFKECSILLEELNQYTTLKEEQELEKIEQIFNFLENGQNFFEYQLVGQDTKILENQQSSQISDFNQFLTYLQQSIQYLFVDEPLKIVFDKNDLDESNCLQNQHYFLLKKFDGQPALIFIDNVKKEFTQISLPAHRQQLKFTAEKYIKYTQNYKFNQHLIKQDTILFKIYEILLLSIEQLQIFTILKPLDLQEMLQITKTYTIYEQLQKNKFDCFQFLDCMQFM